MKDFHTLQTMPAEARGGVVVIGNFDGVHKGHQSVLQTARAKADALAAQINPQEKRKHESVPLVVLIFDPHPRQFFAPDAPCLRLTRLPRRARLLKSFGADHIIVLQFDEALANMSADDFIADILCHALAAKAICVGRDFRFGKGRSGTTAMLQERGKERGFDVVLLDVLKADRPNAPPYSSTAIRECLTNGDMQEAAALLGHFWRLEGVVEKGDGRGRQLGCPTANLAVTDYHLPRFGVYAVQVEITGDTAEDTAQDKAWQGKLFGGIANLGIRPSFATSEPRLEVHLFDFDGDLYGASLAVALIAFIRPEKNFGRTDATDTKDATDVATKLAAQIVEDATQARQILASTAPLC